MTETLQMFGRKDLLWMLEDLPYIFDGNFLVFDEEIWRKTKIKTFHFWIHALYVAIVLLMNT